MDYNVKSIRSAGLEARWTKTSAGAPIIVARKPHGHWYAIDNSMWKRAAEVGIVEAFEEHTTLGEFFSIPI